MAFELERSAKTHCTGTTNEIFLSSMAQKMRTQVGGLSKRPTTAGVVTVVSLTPAPGAIFVPWISVSPSVAVCTYRRTLTPPLWEDIHCLRPLQHNALQVHQ